MALSQKQIRAAELLAKGHSQEEAGKAVGASRRSVSRWLQQEDFRNLSYGLVGRVSQSPQKPSQPQRERHRQSGSLTPEALIQDALLAVQAILVDPEVRTGDRLKAASLVGEWAGLGSDKNKMAEMEAIKVLVEANWLGDEAVEVLRDAGSELEQKMKNALANGTENGHKNGHKKALLQKVSEGGLFDNEFNDEFDDDE